MRWTDPVAVRQMSCMNSARETEPGKLQMLVLERRDDSCNLARFYVLAIEPTLFGDTALIREWGRIGANGRRRLDLHADHETAAEALDVWLTRKAARGYRLRCP
ncbi:WGR domain-containing protein [Bosea sp. OK403]|uniref:WGR domain-containing protein n=1 Tax=Bosea sp. OK403 TaxID=1855286 RepID=UPI000A3EB1C4|nr:WGR domain-containing protein [Bosea sp. OK403]